MSSRRVITKLAAVAPGAGLAVPGLYDAEGVNRWRLAVDAAHERGDSIIARLWHPGDDGAIDTDAKEALLDAFRVAAEGASDAGFDGIALAETPGLTPSLREHIMEALVAVWGASGMASR